MNKSKVLLTLIETLLNIFHPLPGIALLPLIILIFGVGKQTILVIIVHSMLWPIVLNLRTGIKSIPIIYHQIGMNYQLSQMNMMKKIYLPSSMPFLISGIRIAFSRGFRALISAEMIFGVAGTIGGLGWYIFESRVFMNVRGIYAGIIVVVFLGIIFEELLFSKIEAITLKKWGMMND